MVYYRDDTIIIRNLEEKDIPCIVEEERAQGYHGDETKYRMRLQDQQEGRSVALAAEYEGSPAGYVNVYFDAQEGPFGGKGYPEIVDFGVLEKYRRRGIGTKLMDTAERIAGQHGDTVYLGVGLHSGYGSAQRMYVKRGYIPDGSGVWYNDSVCEPYAPCRNDDGLNLYLIKKLR